MALNWGVNYPSQTGAPGASYPYAPAQNVTLPGDGTGFPWEADTINDWGGFFQALLIAAGITPSGIPDTVLASDYFDSLDLLLSLIDDKYKPDNAELLLLNDTSVAPGSASIGDGYKGIQSYGGYAEGILYVGRNAVGSQYQGFQAVGSQYYGNAAVGIQTYGGSAVGDQYYGVAASGDQYYGQSATGAIEVGSVSGSAATKKLISGAKEATFEDLIDATTPEGAWQTPTLLNGWAFSSGSLRYRLIDNGNSLQIVGALDASSSTGTTFMTLTGDFVVQTGTSSVRMPGAYSISTDGPAYVDFGQNSNGNISCSAQGAVNISTVVNINIIVPMTIAW